MFVSGFVSVVGRPNVGKSTLINSFLGQKVLIVSPKPQTTRDRIQAILTTEKGQIIFLDTPGMHKARNKLGDYMVSSATSSLKDVDLILFVVDASVSPGPGDAHIAGILSKIKTPVFLVANKIDLSRDGFAEKQLPFYREIFNFKEFFTVSALTGENLDQLLHGIMASMPPGPCYFPPEMVTDRPDKFLAGEIIREKIITCTREEIPHSIAVLINRMEPRDDGLLVIEAVVFVEKKSQKGIIIGKDGAMLKKIGTMARVELEKYFGKRLFLDIWVKVKKDWRQKESVLRQLGYFN
ncbi:MAG: GTPase Era [Firmicutes bacterium]|nr:GTPase Era [Bacillota bacterium]